MIYFLAGVAAIAGLLFGYDEGVIAVASPTLRADFPMSALVDGFMTAAVPLGALIGAILAGRLTDRFGRRRVLMAAATLFAAGALGAAMIEALWVLVLARLVLGLAVGLAAVVSPLYISESAPLSIRGALVATYQLAITFGIVASYLTGLLITGPGSWRVMFAVGAVPGFLFLLGLLFLPESPRWLVLRGRAEEAADSLTRLRGGQAGVAAEISEIARYAGAETKADTGFAALLHPTVFPALVVGVGLFFLQQLSGINAVIYYAPQIFNHAGFDDHTTQVLATVGIGTVNFVVTILAMWLIDHWGRRPLLVAGFAGTAASLLLIAATLLLPSLLPSWIVIVALLAYIASFAVSVGPLPHVMMSEVFPLRARGPGMSMASVSNWGFNFIVVFSFPLLLADFGLAATFSLFGVICIAGIGFTLLRVPETNGLSLERIEAHLRSGQPLALLRPTP
jgi:sugar porter (SP) family MFS transporter